MWNHEACWSQLKPFGCSNLHFVWSVGSKCQPELTPAEPELCMGCLGSWLLPAHLSSPCPLLSGVIFSGFLSNISRCFVMFMSWIWVLFSKTPSSSAYNLTEHVTQIFWKKLMMLPKASVILLLQILTVYPKQVVLAQLLFQVKQFIRNKKIAVTKEDWQLKNSVLPQTLKALKQHHYDWK